MSAAVSAITFASDPPGMSHDTISGLAPHAATSPRSPIRWALCGGALIAPFFLKPTSSASWTRVTSATSVACHNPWMPVDASPRAVPHRSRGSVRRVASMPSYPGSPSGTHAAHGPITGNGAGAAVTGAAGRLDPEVVGDLAGKEGGPSGDPRPAACDLAGGTARAVCVQPAEARSVLVSS